MTQTATAHANPRPSIVNPDGTTNRIWLSSYVEGVVHDIDVNKYRSLTQYFDECMAKFRDRPGFVSIGTELMNSRLERLVKEFAGWLQSQGVKKGDRVAIMLPNTFQYPVCLFAVLRIGAIVVNVNPLYTARELNHQLKDSGAETIIVMENFAKTLQEALPGTNVKRIVLTQIGDLLSDSVINAKGRLLNFVIRKVQKMVPEYKLPGAIWIRDALKAGSKVKVKDAEVHPDDLAFLQYTGGTTGVSKGAMLTHRNVLTNCQQALAFAEGQLTGDTETVVTPLPLYHIFSLTVNCLIFMALGGRNILIANPRDTKRVMMILKNENFSGITCVNTLYASFLDDPEFRKRNFSNLKLAVSGGMALQRSIAERWKEVTGNSIVAHRHPGPCGSEEAAARLHGLDRRARALDRGAHPSRRWFLGRNRRAGRTGRAWPAGHEGLLESPRRNRQGHRPGGLAGHGRHCRDGREGLPQDRGPQEGHDPGLGLQRLSERDRGCRGHAPRCQGSGRRGRAR